MAQHEKTPANDAGVSNLADRLASRLHKPKKLKVKRRKRNPKRPGAKRGQMQDRPVATWVLQAEVDYVRRNFTLQKIGEKYGKSAAAVARWSKLRDWVQKRNANIISQQGVLGVINDKIKNLIGQIDGAQDEKEEAKLFTRLRAMQIALKRFESTLDLKADAISAMNSFTDFVMSRNPEQEYRDWLREEIDAWFEYVQKNS